MQINSLNNCKGEKKTKHTNSTDCHAASQEQGDGTPQCIAEQQE